ncbi:hypothetical protein HaLaN_04924 [Haematococcus lacustris]|uniref:Uncharacterized protein n=1 Tax=Haematococcus lacustris TaxID=44745 RepID=A0A699YTL9_HAELA|nr:hypothetical protein HaLaN_04924 [Haematococcus lacustris]
MDALSAEDRSWLLSCLALDLQAQLPDAFLYQMLAPLAAHANNATLQECSPSTLVRLLQLVQHTSRAPASHAWSAKLLAAVELRLLLKPPEDIAAHGQEQPEDESDPPAAAQEEVDQARGSVGQGQEADICSTARRLGLGLALACLKRRDVKHLVLVPDLLAKTVFALRQLEVKPPQQWLKEFEQVATSLVPSMSAPLLARCLVSLHLLGHTPSLLLVDMAAKVLRQSLEGMAAAHPVDLALGLAGLYAALADPQRAHQDSAGQQAESIAQTARLLAKAWLVCHKTKPDLLLALPRAELLLVSQALQAMLCSPNAAKQGVSQVLMAVADGSVGQAKSQALAALTPDSVWLVRWAQAMDAQQAAQAVSRSPDNQTSTGGVERLSPPSALQVAYVVLETTVTVAPLSLELNVAWPKPLVTLVKGSMGVLAAQLEQGKVLDADMAAVERYVRSMAQPLGGELPMSFMEAYVGRAMQQWVYFCANYQPAKIQGLVQVASNSVAEHSSHSCAAPWVSAALCPAVGLHQLAALVTWLPLVKVQDEPSNPAWCWHEVKLQLQLVVLQCLHGLTLPYTTTSGEPGEDGAVKAHTLDLPTCLALCTCAAFVTSAAPAAPPSPDTLSQSGILQLPPQVTLALRHALQQLSDFALTPHNENPDIAASATAAADSTGHSALHQQLHALGWAQALTLTLPASPAGGSQEKHQAATQNVPLDPPSSAGYVTWPGPIPGKQLAAVLDLRQLAELQAATNADQQAELFRLHQRLAQVCHAWYAGDARHLQHQPSGQQRADDGQQVPPGPWCMQLATLLELLMLSGALNKLYQVLAEELRATAKASSPQALDSQQASGTVLTLLRVALQDCALHHYAAKRTTKSALGFLLATACMLPLLVPSQQPGQDEDWATGLSPLGTEPEAVQALRCLMMGQVMSCAVQLALSVQQPGSHSELSGTAQQGQPQSLGALTVLQVGAQVHGGGADCF